MSTLKKAVQVLQVVAARGSVTPKQLAETLRLSKSTAYRLILSLTEVQLLERIGAGDGFVLGPLIRELSGGQLLGEQLLHIARPHMIALRDACGETVGLHSIQGAQRMLLGQEVSGHEHRWVFSNVKVPMPLHAGAASKMLLASLPTETAKDLLDNRTLPLLTESTPRTRERLMKELDRIRTQGYALSFQEVVPGIASIAIPLDIAMPNIPAPIVLSITGPRQRLSEPVLKALLPQLKEKAVRIAAETGRRSRPLRAVG